MAEETVITRVHERFGCLYVEGKVLRDGTWLTAKFTIPKSEVIQMSRAEFEAFAQRNLPSVTIDKQWSPAGEVLV